MSLPDLLLVTLITYAPACTSNMSPPIAAALKLPFGKPIAPALLGGRKTARGFIIGISVGTLTSYLLHRLGLLPYASMPWREALLAGGLMGSGAMLGDAVKSAVKRRRRIPEGQPFPPWDQLDFILGGTILAILAFPIPLSTFTIAILLTPPLHLMVNVAAFSLKLKDVWW